jgi:hypothetical protein
VCAYGCLPCRCKATTAAPRRRSPRSSCGLTMQRFPKVRYSNTAG